MTVARSSNRDAEDQVCSGARYAPQDMGSALLQTCPEDGDIAMTVHIRLDIDRMTRQDFAEAHWPLVEAFMSADPGAD
jgi:hypothetical protein